jgi:hypothetical protein
VLRYVIEHPTAGRHTIVAQPLRVVAASGTATGAGAPAGAASPAAASGTVEPGIDRPGSDIANVAVPGDDPLACQALCAADGACRAWTFVHPAEPGGAGMCWTKFEVPEAQENPCCTSGVIDRRAEAPAPAPAAVATLDAPGTVAAGAQFTVRFTGPLFDGDWIDVITPGNEDDMSGGWAWGWASGEAVTLTAPTDPGTYTLRYVAEDPVRGRTVLARAPLTVVAAQPDAAAPAPNAAAAPAPVLADVLHRCEATEPQPCQITDAGTGVTFQLWPGYGLTEPFFYETAGGARAERPSVDLVRLSDGRMVAMFNQRQAAWPGCFEQAGNTICPLEALEGADGAALALVIASLSGMADAAPAPEFQIGDDPGAGEDDFRGAWVIRVYQDGHPRNESPLVAVDLRNAAEPSLPEGPFRSAADFAGFAERTGTARLDFLPGGRMRLDLVADSGEQLTMTATPFGPWDWTGELSGAGVKPPLGVAFSLVAGPEDDWSFPDWTRADAGGMAAGLRMGQEAIQGILGEASPEDRQMVEMLGRIMGGAAGAMGAPAAGQGARGATSPQMQALGGTLLPGLDAEAALILLAPHLEN